jgi:hypothetical protein
MHYSDNHVVMRKRKTKPISSAKKVAYVSVGHLKFDSLNPRLPNYIDKSGDKEVVEWMLKEANIVELMGSIGEQGYFEGEPLIVVPSKNQPKHFEVVEGNRRLTAVKLLLNPELAETRKSAVLDAAQAARKKPTRLPVLTFASRDQVLRYLAYRHITGIEPWNPLQKARYLKQLATSSDFKRLEKKDLRRRLAKEIGSNSNYVARLLAGLAVYEAIEDSHFFEIAGLDEKTISYSVLTTALTYDALSKFIGLKGPTDDEGNGLAKNKLKELTVWLFEKNSEGQTRLGESRNLQKLARVVDEPKALLKFRGGRPLSEADLLTSGPVDAFRTSLSEAKARLETARDCVHLIEKFSNDDGDQLKEIQKLSRLLLNHVDDTLMDGPKSKE